MTPLADSPEERRPAASRTRLWLLCVTVISGLPFALPARRLAAQAADTLSMAAAAYRDGETAAAANRWDSAIVAFRRSYSLIKYPTTAYYISYIYVQRRSPTLAKQYAEFALQGTPPLEPAYQDQAREIIAWSDAAATDPYYIDAKMDSAGKPRPVAPSQPTPHVSPPSRPPTSLTNSRPRLSAEAARPVSQFVNPSNSLDGPWTIVMHSDVSSADYQGLVQLTLEGGAVSGTIDIAGSGVQSLRGIIGAVGDSIDLVRDTRLETIQHYRVAPAGTELQGRFWNVGRYGDAGSVVLRR